MRFLLAFLTLLLPLTASAQQASPIVKATLLADMPVLAAGSEGWIGVALDITEGWHVYWRNPGDSGLAPSVAVNAPQGLEAGEIAWPAPKRQPYGEMMNYGYDGRVLLPIPLKVIADTSPASLTVKADWLVCKDTCIPESAELTINLPNNTGAEAIQQALSRVPLELYEAATYRSNDTEILLQVNLAQSLRDDLREGLADAEWIPQDDGIIRNAAKQTVTLREGTLELRTARGIATPADIYRGVLHLKNARGEMLGSYAVAARHQGMLAPQEFVGMAGLFTALLLAFLGGLLLNLMPCVLPILSLKALALAKKAEASRRAAALQGLAYTLGVLVCFAALGGLLEVLKASGAAVGWGFQLQSPEVIAALAFLMLLVALNLFGWFYLPSISPGGRSEDSLSGSFFTGALAVAVATPCTAPFMAPALGFAATQTPLVAMGIFLALGLGLAAPFLLISLWPAARRLLPKPGVWMEGFKQFLGFLMLATGVWLVWVLVQLNGPQGLFITLMGMVWVSALIWWIARRHTAVLRLLGWALLIASLFLLIRAQPPVQSPVMASSEQGVARVAYSPETLANLRAKGTPVFVDATAAWCITCKVNERVALRDAAIEKLFREQQITLMIADWTARDATIREYLAQYGRDGVPLYVYYAPQKEGVVLPQILTPRIVRTAIEKANAS